MIHIAISGPRALRKPSPKILSVTTKSWASSPRQKKNGTCNVLAVGPDGSIKAMTRHETVHKLWTPSAKTAAPFKNLPRQNEGWYVFVAELMHSKVAGGTKDTNYIHDILVADGEYLVGKTFEERQAILVGLFPDIDQSKSTVSYHVIDDNTWLARNYSGALSALYDTVIADPSCEGLVLKNPKAKLAMCSRQKSNTDWQVKCRRPHKNYSF